MSRGEESSQCGDVRKLTKVREREEVRVELHREKGASRVQQTKEGDGVCGRGDEE